jgi:hypothetical protein
MVVHHLSIEPTIPFFKSSSAALATAASPTVYLIRHGEKPSDGGNGLNAQGIQRAQRLRSVFSSSSDYDISYVMAQTPKSSILTHIHIVSDGDGRQYIDG